MWLLSSLALWLAMRYFAARMHDHDILRELARRVAEIAALSAQRETIARWKTLNGLRPVRPLVMIDQIPWHEMDVDGELTLQCQEESCRGWETQLRQLLYRWKHLPSDYVVEAVLRVPKVIHSTGFGYEREDITAVLDTRNDVVGHAYVDQIKTEADIERIHAPELTLDAEATARKEAQAREIFEGILDVQMCGPIPVYAPWDIIVQWRNPEAILYDLADRPEFLHQIARRLTSAQLTMLDRLEQQGLLGHSQSWIHCTGAWTEELPAPGFHPQRPRSRDLWTFGMSQIFSTVSPAMHEEFELPNLSPWFARFGLAYYGCCEPLDTKLPMIRKLPHVRKISMSPWVDVERGAEAIGRDFVFSRKPSPALLAVDHWNPSAVAQDLRATRDACRRHGCPLELILKDISTVRYQPQRLWEWAAIARQVVEE